ncbi:hypothetical protein [Spiroplasma tabanidicola]|uniref:Lipoprotein n=1 Tax=Spiroplasma tabanidicola TaxID=324079 RepID=A0A6I6CAM6_9MOLU|nr:hypothetical protein [Spiroplasma tabanidicola]QGS51981.1 hypothetical protein STABA_v1c06200 [Spiroplasma tabanidicola]
MKKLLITINTLLLSSLGALTLSACDPKSNYPKTNYVKWELSDTKFELIKQGLKKSSIEIIIETNLREISNKINNYSASINKDFYVKFYNKNNLYNEIKYTDNDNIYGDTTIIITASDTTEVLKGQKTIKIDKLNLEKLKNTQLDAGYKMNFYEEKIKAIFYNENSNINPILNVDYKIINQWTNNESFESGSSIKVSAIKKSKILSGEFEINVVSYDSEDENSVFIEKYNFSYTQKFSLKKEKEHYDYLKSIFEKEIFSWFVFKDKEDLSYRFEYKSSSENYLDLKIITGVFVKIVETSKYIKQTQNEFKLNIKYY